MSETEWDVLKIETHAYSDPALHNEPHSWLACINAPNYEAAILKAAAFNISQMSLRALVDGQPISEYAAREIQKLRLSPRSPTAFEALNPMVVVEAADA
jgi:hypothetical protein